MRVPLVLRPLLHPLRIGCALAIGLLVGVGFAPLVGTAIATDQTSDEIPIPASFRLPPLASGDRGLYQTDSVTVVAGIETIQPQGARFQFEWAAERPALTREGTLQVARELWIQDVDVPVDGNQTLFLPDTNVFVVGRDGVVLAHGGHLSSHWMPACETFPVGPCFQDEWTQFRILRYAPEPGIAPPCGLQNSFQGVAQPLAQPALFSPPCAVAGYVHTPRLAAVDAHVDKGRTILHLASVEGPAIDMWLRDDLSVPLRIETQAPDGATLRVSLIAFEHAAARKTLVPDRVAPEPIEYAPREVWGPSDEGFPHPFPLSRAFAFARDDPMNDTLRRFLTQNPDSYVASAYVVEESAQVVSEGTTWHFAVADEDDEIHVAVRNIKLYMSGYTDLLEYAAPNIVPAPRPSPETLPNQMPTAASIVGRWEAYRESLDSRPLPPLWGFDVRCADESCPTADVTYAAGILYMNEAGLETAISGVGRQDGIVVDQLLLDQRMHALEVRYSEEGGQLVRGVLTSQPGTDPPALAQIETVAPKGSAAAAIIATGLLGLLAGLTVWLWPLVRQVGGLALFSRIEGPAVLEHPKRSEIMALVTAQPGVHFQEIRRILRLSHGTLIHHLRRLEANKLVVRRRVAGHTCYFPQGTPTDEMIARAHKNTRRIDALAIIRNQPGVTPAQLARALGLARQSVHEQCERLQRDGLIAVTKNGRSTRLHATALTARVLQAEK